MRRTAFILLLLFVCAGCETTSDVDPATELTDVPFVDAVIPHDRNVELLSNRWSD